MTVGEHVLVVGGGMQIPRLLREHGEGCRTSVLCQMYVLPRLQDVSGHERVIALRADSADSEWVAAASHVHAADPFTRVAAFGERDQMRAAEVAQALDLEFHQPRTVRAVHDKSLMRQVLAESGVEDVRSVQCDDVELLREHLTHNPGTWVVKPLDGSASAGVSVVSDPDEAEVAYRRCVGAAHSGDTGSSTVLVEEFLEGRQFSVESLTEDGEHCIIAITGKYSDRRTLVELGHVVPADLCAQDAEEVARHVDAVLDALQVRSGACHTEIVLTADGPRVIETHLRLAGDEIPTLVRDATGVDLVDCVVRQTIGERVLPKVRSTLEGGIGTAQAIWFGTSSSAGTVVKIDGMDAAGSLHDSIRIAADVEPGTTVGRTDDSHSRVLSARASGTDAATALALARRAVACCSLIVALPLIDEDAPTV